MTTRHETGLAAPEDRAETPGDDPQTQGDESPSPDEAEVRALLRFSGEIATKSRRTRARFQRRLTRNLRDALDSQAVPAVVRPEWSRVFIDGPDDTFLDPLERVFGISSYSVLRGETEADLERIVERGVGLFGDEVKGRTYAVRARRSGEHPFSSHDVQQHLGAALNPGATVNLGNPDVAVRIEIRDDRAFFYADRHRGAGGLPLGVQGRALCLLSGGFDSAVAAWMALRRGIVLDYVFCNLGGGAYKRMVVEVGKHMADQWSYGTRPRLHVVDFTEVVEAMRVRAKPAYLQVVLKRMFYRAAARIGAGLDTQALVTGESVGQVSSQTLTNLRAIDDASDLPVLRPLLGFHKEEIIARSREIGTYELSARVREYCQVAPDKPVTAASPEDARAQEDAVGHVELNSAIESLEVLDLRGLRMSDIVGAGLFVTAVEPGVTVLDTRDPGAYEAWHWPRAARHALEALERDFKRLDRNEVYVLYCAEGVRTANLAERMQREGYEAYSFMGGVPALRRLANRLDQRSDDA